MDDAQQFSFTDSASQGVLLDETLRFFQDNTSGGSSNEASPGAVARIRLYNKALTAEEVAALNQLPRQPLLDRLSGAVTRPSSRAPRRWSD